MSHGLLSWRCPTCSREVPLDVPPPVPQANCKGSEKRPSPRGKDAALQLDGLRPRGEVMGSTPLTFRCSRCKVCRDWRDHETASSDNLSLTGRSKVIANQAGRLGLTAVEYHHSCGFTGWTTHPSMVGRLVPDAENRR